MKRLLITLLIALLAGATPAADPAADPAAGGIDFRKAGKIPEKRQSGQVLTADEQATLERAKAAMAARNAPGGTGGAAPGGDIDWDKARRLFQREQRGESLDAGDRAYLERAKAIRGRGGGGRPAAGGQRQPPERLTPLPDLKAGETYEGEDGGLYGGGSNTPPESQVKAAREQLARIRPLNGSGEPAAEGRIVLVSISMSNATQEFSAFKRLADAAPQKSPALAIVDCAQGGQAMAEWAPPGAAPWEEARRRLDRAGVTPRQVQVAWIKLANKGPSGSFEEHGRKLEADTLAVLHQARAVFPNLRLAYLGSRIWAGHAKGGLNPEPYAYESAFVARRLIQRQIRGDAELSPSRSPVLLWGPYLWAEGAKGRKLDSLVWEPGDFAGDGVHPSASGRAKVAKLLLDFFTHEPLAAPWFVKDHGLAPP